MANSVGKGSLAVVAWETDEGAGPQQFSALGVCVAVDNNGLATLAAMGLDTSAAPDDLMNIKVILPGIDGDEIPATLLGIDPLTSIAFFRTDQAHDWKPVQFVRESGVSVGDEVVSVGLLSSDLGRLPYVGKAYVSASIRTPNKIFMVAGGNLTQTGSLVLNANGELIGIVGQQLFSTYQMVLQRQPVIVPMRGQQWTDSFLPVEEFADVFDHVPSSPDQVRQVPWLGALGVEAVERNLWEGYSLKSPGVKLMDIVPGSSADKAGLIDGDIVFAMNGEPLEQLATADLTARQMLSDFSQMSVGQTITIDFLRDLEQRRATMTLEVWPKRPNQAARYVDLTIGIRIREKVELDQYINKSTAATVPGLIVLLVAPKSPADRAGLQAGDLIVSIAGQPVRTIEVYKQLVEKETTASVTSSIDMLVRRGDQDKVIAIRLN